MFKVQCYCDVVLYHCCGIVGVRCLSTISWLVTPGLHSAHVHCNHYDDDDDDDVIVVDDGGGGGINRWS